MDNRGIAIATPRSRSDWVKVAVDFSPRVDRKIAWRRGATLARRLAPWRTKRFNRRCATASAPGSCRGLKSTATVVPSLRDSPPACGSTEARQRPRASGLDCVFDCGVTLRLPPPSKIFAVRDSAGRKHFRAPPPTTEQFRTSDFGFRTSDFIWSRWSRFQVYSRCERIPPGHPLACSVRMPGLVTYAPGRYTRYRCRYCGCIPPALSGHSWPPLGRTNRFRPSACSVPTRRRRAHS